MNALILAAGYGTRMRQMLGDRPKALIELGGMTLLDRICADLQQLDVDITLVSNDHYYDQFERWRAQQDVALTLLNDGSSNVSDRLGAIGDLALAIDTFGFRGDLLVMAADNLLTFSLADMLSQFRASGHLQLAVWKNPDMQDQQRRGVVSFDAQMAVTAFAEKPREPASAWAAAPIYMLPAACVKQVATYLDEGGNPDAPGHLMAYLCGRERMQAWPVPGQILDVGNPDSYAQALKQFA